MKYPAYLLLGWLLALASLATAQSPQHTFPRVSPAVTGVKLHLIIPTYTGDLSDVDVPTLISQAEEVGNLSRDYYWRESFGQVRVDHVISPPFQVPSDLAAQATARRTQQQLLGGQLAIEFALQATGLDANEVDIVQVMAGNNIPSFGTVGAFALPITQPITTRLIVNFRTSRNLRNQAGVHEVGHTLSMAHSGVAFTSNTDRFQITPFQGEESNEQDPTEIMSGNGADPDEAGIGNNKKSAIGWIVDGDIGVVAKGDNKRVRLYQNNLGVFPGPDRGEGRLAWQAKVGSRLVWFDYIPGAEVSFVETSRVAAEFGFSIREETGSAAGSRRFALNSGQLNYPYPAPVPGYNVFLVHEGEELEIEVIGRGIDRQMKFLDVRFALRDAAPGAQTRMVRNSRPIPTVPANAGRFANGPLLAPTTNGRVSFAGNLQTNNFNITASQQRGGSEIEKALDGDLSTRYTSGRPQRPGELIKISSKNGSATEITRIVMDSTGSPNDAAVSWAVREGVLDGNTFEDVPGRVLASGTSTGAIIDARLPEVAGNGRTLFIEQTGTSNRFWWSIHELSLFDSPAPGTPTTAPRRATPPPTGNGGGGPTAFTLAFEQPTRSTFGVGETAYTKAVPSIPTSEIANVRLTINGTFFRQENGAPYEWAAPSQNDALLKNLAAGTYNLSATATAKDGRTATATTSFTVTAPNAGGGNGGNGSSVIDSPTNTGGFFAADNYKWDFGPANAPLQSGWSRFTNQTRQGFARWTSTPGRFGAVIHTGGELNNNLRRSLIWSFGAAEMVHQIPNGRWEVAVTFSDRDAKDNLLVRAEGTVQASNIDFAARSARLVTFEVDVTDGELNLVFDDADANKLTAIGGLELTRKGDVSSNPSAPARNNWRYDFGTANSALQAGWERISMESRSGGSARFLSGGITSRDRGRSRAEDDVRRDLVFGNNPTVFQVDTGNGTFNVRIMFGDYGARHDNYTATAEGVGFGSITTNGGSNPRVEVDRQVTVTDGKLDITFADQGGTDVNWSILGVLVTRQ